MKRLLLLAALFVLAVPVAYAAPPGGQGEESANQAASPSDLCREQRRTMGMASFRSTYAPTGSPKAAFDACVAKLSQAASTNAKNAAKACQAERAKDPLAFQTKYGKNTNKANAFGKCVSMTARGLTEAQQDATLDAAAACTAERQQMGADAFAGKYGTNAKKSNAFGKCIQKLKKPTQQP